jgi:hypothetical protein
MKGCCVVKRFDSFRVQGFKRTPQGYLSLSGVVTRSGIFKYDTGDELRPEDEVLKQESLDTLTALPVTYPHPPDLLEPSTTAQYQKGFLVGKPQSERRDRVQVIKVDGIIVTDPGLIYAVENKEVDEFSMGYTCDLDETPGELDGQPYTKIQRNIIYNHLAFVPDARGGRVCTITEETDGMAKKFDSVVRTDAGDDVSKKEEKKEDKKDSEGEKEEDKKEDKKDSEDKDKKEDKKEDKKDSDDDRISKLEAKLDALIESLSGNKKDATDDGDNSEGSASPGKQGKMDSISSILSDFSDPFAVLGTRGKRNDSAITYTEYNRDSFIKDLLCNKRMDSKDSSSKAASKFTEYNPDDYGTEFV